MIPATLNINIYQGDDYELTFRMKDGDTNTYVNLTGMTGRAQIRASKDATAVLSTFTVAILDQTVAPGGVYITLTPAQTAAIPLSGGVWDVELRNTGATWVRTPLAGAVSVVAEVTR